MIWNQYQMMPNCLRAIRNATALQPHPWTTQPDGLFSAVSSITKSAVVRVYRAYAPIYDLVFGRVLRPGRIAMAKIVADVKPRQLLEVGVGTGLALPDYPSNTAIFGIDISDEMLRRAQALVDKEDIRNVELLCADAEHLPFPDASFDCITVPYVLSVTPSPERLLAELARVCTPDGRVLIINHFKGAGVWQLGEKLLEPLAERVGFRSDLTLDALDSPYWNVVSVSSVNLFGLSKLVELRKTNA